MLPLCKCCPNIASALVWGLRMTEVARVFNLITWYTWTLGLFGRPDTVHNYYPIIQFNYCPVQVLKPWGCSKNDSLLPSMLCLVEKKNSMPCLLKPKWLMKSHLVKGGNLKKDYNFFSKILALPVLSGLYHSIGVAQGNEPVIVICNCHDNYRPTVTSIPTALA